MAYVADNCQHKVVLVVKKFLGLCKNKLDILAFYSTLEAHRPKKPCTSINSKEMSQEIELNTDRVEHKRDSNEY